MRRIVEGTAGNVEPPERSRGIRYNALVDVATALAIVGIAATAAFIQALSGFGFALFAVPLLAILIGPKDTVLLSNLLSTFSTGMQARNLRHSADRRAAFTLMAGSAAGMPVGLVVLLLVEPRVLQLVIAVVVIISTVAIMRGLALHAAGLLGDLAAGVTSGVLNTSTSMSGPPIVLYLQGKGMEPLPFRATIATFFFATSATAVVLLLLVGQVRPYVFVAWALCVPAIFTAQTAGNRLFHRVNVVLFRRMVYAILFVSAAVAIVGAMT
jgi:uncharacterized membrane protein YfcA